MDNTFALNGLDFSPEINMARYLQSIRKFPILEQDEEFELATRYKETKDEKIAYKLVTSHLRLVEILRPDAVSRMMMRSPLPPSEMPIYNRLSLIWIFCNVLPAGSPRLISSGRRGAECVFFNKVPSSMRLPKTSRKVSMKTTVLTSFNLSMRIYPCQIAFIHIC